jgi:nucleoside-diphosphate-sugar epimerase
MGDLARNLIGIIRPAARIELGEARLRPEKSEVERLLGDNTKIRTLTGWAPMTSLDKGLRTTIDWFTDRDNLARYKTNIYNV